MQLQPWAHCLSPLQPLLHLGQAGPSPCLEPWRAQIILERPKLSSAGEVQHLRQPIPLLPPTAPALHLWPGCSPSSGSPVVLHQPSRTIPRGKLSAKPFIPLSSSHRSPSRDPHEHPQRPRGNSCPIVAAPQAGAQPLTWAEVLDQKPNVSAVPTQPQPHPNQDRAFKKLDVLFLTNERGGPDGSSASLKSKHNSKALASSHKHMNSLQGLCRLIWEAR